MKRMNRPMPQVTPSFRRPGDGVEDGLPHRSDGEDNEEQALQEDRSQGNLPGVALFDDHGVGEVGVQPHARGPGRRDSWTAGP